jgi:hypothetical protein
MHAQLAQKWQAIGTRCSIFASCLCGALVVFLWACPRYAFGMSDDHFAIVLEAVSESAMLFSSLNALFAVGMMVRFPNVRRSPWLWAALALPVYMMLLMPAIQTA